jgi:hypothetical protein
MEFFMQNHKINRVQELIKQDAAETNFLHLPEELHPYFKPFLTIKDVAIMLGFSIRSAYRFIRFNKVRAYAPTAGAHKLYLRGDVEKALLRTRVN